jgi:hypothetical protein
MTQTETVEVTLTPVMNGNGSFNSWQMSVNKGAPQGPGNYPAIPVGNGNKADFAFTIQNGPQQNITFADALVPAESKEIHALAGKGTTTLTFKDHNWNQGQVPYELLFNGAPKLDPIINNGGGGPPLYYNYIIDGAALLAVFAIGLVIQKVFRLI